MFENTRLIGSSWTPRVAVNYLITPRQSLRAVYSEAIRSPDMFENNVNWSYRVTHLQPTAYGQTSARYFVKTRGPGDLDNERMRLRELGYMGKANLELASILQQRLDNQPTTFVDNNYDERRVLYFSAELKF